MNNIITIPLILFIILLPFSPLISLIFSFLAVLFIFLVQQYRHEREISKMEQDIPQALLKTAVYPLHACFNEWETLSFGPLIKDAMEKMKKGAPIQKALQFPKTKRFSLFKNIILSLYQGGDKDVSKIGELMFKEIVLEKKIKANILIQKATAIGGGILLPILLKMVRSITNSQFYFISMTYIFVYCALTFLFLESVEKKSALNILIALSLAMGGFLIYI